jgi:uncharacterized Tic20 family protein
MAERYATIVGHVPLWKDSTVHDAEPPPGETPPPWYSYGSPQGYDPRYGYGPPGNPGGPRGTVAGDDVNWALGVYIGSLVMGFIAPLVIYFVKRRESGFVRFHAAQALNYQLTVTIQLLVPLIILIPLAIVLDAPVVLLPLVPLFLFHVFAQYVFIILAAVKAGRGEYWRMPTFTCFRMIR